jgi:hypothetical protein
VQKRDEDFAVRHPGLYTAERPVEVQEERDFAAIPVSRQQTLEENAGKSLTPHSAQRTREYRLERHTPRPQVKVLDEPIYSPFPLPLEPDLVLSSDQRRPQSKGKRRLLELTDLPGVLIRPAHLPVRSICTQTPNYSSISPFHGAAIDTEPYGAQADLPADSNSVSPYETLPAGDALVEDRSLHSLFGAEVNQPSHWRTRLDSMPARLYGQRSTSRLIQNYRGRLRRAAGSRPLSVLKNPKRSLSGEGSIGRSESPRSNRSRSPLIPSPSKMRLPTRVIMMRNLPNRALLPRLRSKVRW